MSKIDIDMTSVLIAIFFFCVARFAILPQVHTERLFTYWGTGSTRGFAGTEWSRVSQTGFERGHR